MLSPVLLIVCECIPEEFLLSTSENVDCLAIFSTNNIIDRFKSRTTEASPTLDINIDSLFLFDNTSFPVLICCPWVALMAEFGYVLVWKNSAYSVAEGSGGSNETPLELK